MAHCNHRQFENHNAEAELTEMSQGGTLVNLGKGCSGYFSGSKISAKPTVCFGSRKCTVTFRAPEIPDYFLRSRIREG